MSTLAATLPTLLDLSKVLDPNGKVQRIAEILSARNEVLDDIQWKEGNLITGEKATLRSSLPTATLRKFNQGINPTKGTTKQVTFDCAMIQSVSEIDADEAALNGNSADWRLTQDAAHMQAIMQKLANLLFYGDSQATPESFVGFSSFFNATTDPQGSQIIKADGAGGDGATLTSVWLVNWGPTTAYGIYPKGMKAGWDHFDEGKVTKTNSDGSVFQILRSYYKWMCGLAVVDYRYICRIANIKVSALTKTGSTGTDLIDKMTQALETVYDMTTGTPVFYVNRTVKSYLRRQINNKSNVFLSQEQVGGREVLKFAGVPVRLVDALTSTESAIS